MSLLSNVATAMQSGLSQPQNFTNFVNSKIAQANGAAMNTVGQINGVVNAANQAVRTVQGIQGTAQNAINSIKNIANMVGVGPYGFDPTALFGSVLRGFGGGGGGPGSINPYGVLSRMQARDDPLLSIDWTATLVDGAGTPIEDIYIEGVQTPSLRFDNKPVYRQGTTVNYAAGLSIDNANLILFNDRSGKALKFATSWYDAVFNFKTRNFRMPIEYKKDIIVWLLDVQGKVVCQIDLVGCFPVSLNSTNLEATGSNLIPVTLDISVDHCYFSGP